LPIEDWGYPEFPYSLEYLWLIFIDLCNSRQSGMSVNPLSYQEIEAYKRLVKESLSIADIQAIKRLDIIALEAMREE
jgi:hypothetical protein